MLCGDLAYWINERHAMKLRKEAGTRRQFGYSDDPFMGEVRYCNVHREDDKVTKWLAHHWRPQHNRPSELALARFINYIPSLEAMLANGLDTAEVTLKKMRAANSKIFTSAYTISTCGQKMDKVDYIMSVVHAVKDAEWRMERPCTLKEAWSVLHDVKGVGSFMAAQIVADMKHTLGNPLDNVQGSIPDWWLWAAPGPGSLKGLADLFGVRIFPSEFSDAIQKAWDSTRRLLTAEVLPMHMQDFQNCLCEFSKYQRVKRGGHVRNRYRPG